MIFDRPASFLAFLSDIFESTSPVSINDDSDDKPSPFSFYTPPPYTYSQYTSYDALPGAARQALVDNGVTSYNIDKFANDDTQLDAMRRGHLHDFRESPAFREVQGRVVEWRKAWAAVLGDAEEERLLVELKEDVLPALYDQLHAYVAGNDAFVWLKAQQACPVWSSGDSNADSDSDSEAGLEGYRDDAVFHAVKTILFWGDIVFHDALKQDETAYFEMRLAANLRKKTALCRTPNWTPALLPAAAFEGADGPQWGDMVGEDEDIGDGEGGYLFSPMFERSVEMFESSFDSSEAVTPALSAGSDLEESDRECELDTDIDEVELQHGLGLGIGLGLGPSITLTQAEDTVSPLDGGDSEALDEDDDEGLGELGLKQLVFDGDACGELRVDSGCARMPGKCSPLSVGPVAMKGLTTGFPVPESAPSWIKGFNL